MNGNLIHLIITIFLLSNQCKSAPMDYDDLKAEESVLLKRKELSEKYWATVKEVIISIFTGLVSLCYTIYRMLLQVLELDGMAPSPVDTPTTVFFLQS